MVQNAAERVTEFILNRVDEGLRAVVIVQPDGFNVTHLDDELRRRYSKDIFTEVDDTFRLEQPFLNPEIEGSPVGERRAIVLYHSNAFVLQFPYSDTETILISVSRDVGRDLLGFIGDLPGARPGLIGELVRVRPRSRYPN